VDAQVQIRQRHRAAAATVSALEGGRLQVRFREPQLSITPGQIAVCYQGDIVLASGVIAKA
jgi:tRNA-specific 2-thiouridylase